MTGHSRPEPAGLWDVWLTTVVRELRLAFRRPGDMATPLIFFAIVVSLFPLAVSPDKQLLMKFGPGVLWVAALLASLMSLGSLFRQDREDGTLEQLLLSGQPVSVLVLGKIAAQWLVTGLPLVIISPVAGVAFFIPEESLPILAGSLVLGTLSLSLIGSVGAALTVGLRQANSLLSLLVLPLVMPVLIFGARAVSLSADGETTGGSLYLLAALTMLTMTFSPFAASAALRISAD